MTVHDVVYGASISVTPYGGHVFDKLAVRQGFVKGSTRVFTEESSSAASTSVREPQSREYNSTRTRGRLFYYQYPLPDYGLRDGLYRPGTYTLAVGIFLVEGWNSTSIVGMFLRTEHRSTNEQLLFARPHSTTSTASKSIQRRKCTNQLINLSRGVIQ